MKRVFTYLAISMALAFLCATTYVVVLTLTLPKADEMHGQAPFQDQMVLPIMALGAVLSGLVGWPLFALLGRRCSPKRVATVTTIATLAVVIGGTPIRSSLGWPGCYVACVAALVYCSIWCKERRSPKAQTE